MGQPPALLATQFTCSGTVLPFGISAPMALDGTAWTAEVCETDSVLEKPRVEKRRVLLQQASGSWVSLQWFPPKVRCGLAALACCCAQTPFSRR